MQRAGGVKAPLSEREALEDVEHLQRRDALRIGWDLGHRPAAVGSFDRLLPLGLEGGKIIELHRAALFADDVHDRLCCGTLVVTVATVLGDSAQRPGQIGIAEDLSGARRAAVDQEGGAGIGMLREELFGARPQAGGDLHYRKTLLRVEDGRREQYRKRPRAELLL